MTVTGEQVCVQWRTGETTFPYSACPYDLLKGFPRRSEEYWSKLGSRCRLPGEGQWRCHVVDFAAQWMRFFCDDDSVLQKIEQEYGPGPVRAGNKMLTGEAKQLLISTLQPIISRHQQVPAPPGSFHPGDFPCLQARAAVSNEMVETFMTPRTLKFTR